MDKILHNVWIGTHIEAAKYGDKFNLIINCMNHSELDRYEQQDMNALLHPMILNVPILVSINDPNNKETYTDAYAHPLRMNFIADILEKYKKDYNILVHCAAGQERSPLAIIWWLYDRMELSNCNIHDVYNFVKIKHPPTLDRLGWLKKLLPPPLYKMEGEA